MRPTDADLDTRIRSLITAAWRRAGVGMKRRPRQQAISILNRAGWRAERVLLRAANRDGGRCLP